MSSEADAGGRAAATPVAVRHDLATIGRRVAAEAIDVAIISAILIGVSIVTGTLLTGAAARGDVGAYLALSGVVGLVFGIIGLAWLLLLSAWHAGGGSPGQRALGIALRRRGDGSHLSFGATLGRILVFRLSTIIIVGYFTPLFDGSGRRQGWHDKVVDAVMIDLRTPDASAQAPSAASDRPVAPAPPAQPILTGSGILPPASGAPRVGVVVDEPAVPPPLPPLPFPPATVASSGVPIPDGLVSEVPGVVRSAPATVEPAPPARPAAPAEALIPPAAEPAPSAEPAPPAAPAPPAVPPASVDAPPALDDEPDVDATRHVAPSRAASTVAAGVTVVWDDGVANAVASAAVFGRNPESSEGRELFAVPDATRSLSKTHFELVVDPDGIWIIDRHSTNGTAIESGGSRRPAPAGERERVLPGDTVLIGDRSFTLRASA